MKLHRSITHDRVEDAVKRRMFGLDNPGFCRACGHEQDGCEPDAVGIICESCGRPWVYGADEILMEMF